MNNCCVPLSLCIVPELTLIFLAAASRPALSPVYDQAAF